MVSAPQTPQAAALAFLHPKFAHIRTSARIVAQTPSYAVLQFSRALIESQLASGQILVKKFPFGWQAIDLSSGNALTFCSVRSHYVPTADFRALRHVLSTSSADCPTGADSDQRDAGPPSDVSAVRALMAGTTEIVPFVRVVGNYAFLTWVGNGGGENFYKKTASGWKMFAGGGGAYQSDELHARYGVPLSIARALLRR